MNFKARIHTSLKKSVLDPQGQTTLHAFESMGFKEAKSLRIGKYFELALEAETRAKAEEYADRARRALKGHHIVVAPIA